MMVGALTGISIGWPVNSQGVRTRRTGRRITASTFQFQPSTITVKKGVPVTLD